nr:RNA-directed DNA polymerase, eukaryota [Tanacetum cinerariifolium]
MFYADDAVFVGQWCDGNINTLVHVLECFFQASRLRINMCKSKIMGVNVGDEKVKSAASKLGCLILNTFFSYLGTKLGGNMSRVQAWTEVVDKVGKVSKAGSRSCWRNIVNEERILSNQETEKGVTVNSKMSDTKLENSLCRSIRGGVEQEHLTNVVEEKVSPIEVEMELHKRLLQKEHNRIHVLPYMSPHREERGFQGKLLEAVEPEAVKPRFTERRVYQINDIDIPQSIKQPKQIQSHRTT